MKAIDLSRRVAKIMDDPGIIQAISENYDAFFGPLKTAQSFDDLPDKIKELIIQAENSR